MLIVFTFPPLKNREINWRTVNKIYYLLDCLLSYLK